MLYAGKCGFERQCQIKAYPRLFKRHMVPLECMSLDTLPKCDDRLHLPDSARGHPYHNWNRPAKNRKRQDKWDWQKSNLIRNARLQHHHFIDIWKQDVRQTCAHKSNCQRNPCELPKKRTDELPAGVTHCFKRS